MDILQENESILGTISPVSTERNQIMFEENKLKIKKDLNKVFLSIELNNSEAANFDIIDNLSNFKNKLIKKWFLKNNHNLSLYKLDAFLPLSNFSVKGRIYKNNDTLLIIGM